MTDRLTPEREAEIRARVEAAMPGPWSTEYRGWDKPEEGAQVEAVVHLTDRSRGWGSWGWGELGRIIAYGTGVGKNYILPAERPQAAANIEFIASAREDIPALLAELDVVRAELKEVEAKLEDPDYLRGLLHGRMIG